MNKKQFVGKKVDREAPKVFAQRLEEFKTIFPEVFTEGNVDFDKLKTALSEEIDDKPERYSFTWAGKKDAIRLLQVPTRATLIPDKGESVDFDATRNIFIEGDNLEVLKLVCKPYFSKIKLIYIDPPYNTGNDFIYKDDYTDPLNTYLMLTKQKDAEGNLMTSNPQTSGRFHSSWLSMMYPRLFIARQLLHEEGSIWVSIDDGEVHNLRMLMNEVFGEENFITSVIWQKKYTRSNDARWFSDNHDYILVYAKSKESCELNLQPRTEEQKAAYSNPDNHPKGPWKATPLHAKSGRQQSFSYTFKNGVRWSPPPGTYPRFSHATLSKLDKNDEIWFGTDGKAIPSRKTFLMDAKVGVTPVTIWAYDEVGHTHEANNELKTLIGEGIFENPKPTRLIKRIMQLTTIEDDIILDFFAGSCTTGQAVFDLNREDGQDRHFIMIQLPELVQADSVAYKAGYKTISDIGKERLRQATKRINESDNGKLHLGHRTAADLGFRVFKLTSSNMRAWKGIDEKDHDSYAKEMELYLDPLIEGWTEEDVICELIIREGYSLSSEFSLDSEIDTNRIWIVTDPDKDQRFLVCLDDKIVEDSILRYARLDKDTTFICRDVALNDETAANLALQCRLKTI